jgi:hypothetical protein
LRYQCWIVWNPVAHNDPTAGPGDTHHLLGDNKWLWREHRSKDIDDEVERLISTRANRMHPLPETRPVLCANPLNRYSIGDRKGSMASQQEADIGQVSLMDVMCPRLYQASTAFSRPKAP